MNAGDILIANPGDRIAVDGVIVKGVSHIDESMLTGESVFPEKEKDAKVYAGSLCADGRIMYRAETVGCGTAISKIVRFVENARSSKAPIERIADRVSGYFVPVVFGIALLSFVLWAVFGGDFSFALNIFVSVLVVACPCALGLAAPMSVIIATGIGANYGILFKNAESIEQLSEVTVAALDKTGTLTEGKLMITDICAAEGVPELSVLISAAEVNKNSNHPVAKAIVREAERRGIEIKDCTEFVYHQGLGMTGKADGIYIKSGSGKFFKEEEISSFSAPAGICVNEGKNITFVMRGYKVIGFIAAADVLKPDTVSVISRLKESGITPVMLTGDNSTSARIQAEKAGIERVISDVLPEQKAEEIGKLKTEGKTVMIGDGINDAPALSAADVGIAVGGGADIATDAASVVLTGSSLRGAADAVTLSKKTMRNIKQNLFLAFIYNIIVIPVAAGALFPFFGIALTPVIAAAMMSLSDVSVIVNALRLNCFRSRFRTLVMKI